ncbi:MAG: hypothetical protein ABI724_09150 [Betaproteobacteria bacterium]
MTHPVSRTARLTKYEVEDLKLILALLAVIVVSLFHWIGTT